MKKIILIGIFVMVVFSISVFADGNDAYTKLLLHLDNNVVDSSYSSPQHSVTNNGVTFTTTPTKWSYSGYFDGSDYLSVPDNDDCFLSLIVKSLELIFV